MTAESEDDALVARGLAGDNAALVELYHRYRPRVVHYLIRMTGDRDLAEEVFAAAFTRLLERLDRYRASGKFAAYLFQIARSRLADEQATRRRFQPPGKSVPLDDLPGPSTVAPEHPLTQAELTARVREAVGKLPDHLREVVVLKIYQGMDYATISGIVGSGEATIRSRMRYALQWLRQSLGEKAAPEDDFF